MHCKVCFKKVIMGAALVVPAALICLISQQALATTQMPEIIYLEGKEQHLLSLPLEQYYGPHNPRPKFTAPHTANWRGYTGIWEIKKGVLYLKSVRAWIDRRPVGLETLFPGQQAPVAATWFTGQLKVPQGKPVRPAVPHPQYGQFLMITVEKGKMVRQEVVDNPRPSQPSVR